MWAAIISVFIGIWIMIAPGLFQFEPAASTNHFIVGPLVVTAAVVAIWDVNRAVRFLNVIMGIWLALSPLLLSYMTPQATWISIISGILLITVSLIKGKIKHSYGGGWKVLFTADKKFFKDKVIVITGATGGVGRVTAWEFAKQGARVVLIARDKAQLENTAKEVQVYGGSALPIQMDISDAEKLELLTERIEQEWGPIDVWINNAMNSVFAPFNEITAKEFRRVTDVTYLGSVYATMCILRRMRRRNKGSIVFVGSALAYRGIPLQSAYCGAKHGMQGFYDSLRTELMHDKSRIKTSMVQLPAMNTTQFGWVLSKLPNKAKPMGKVYQPEVAARAIVFAAKHNRREVLVGFPTYKAIVGNKIAPWYADWVLSRQGYAGQQTNEPAAPNRKDNLWEPVGEDRGAYGSFEDVAAKRSFTLWFSMNRAWIRVCAAVIITFLFSWLFFYHI
jgi:short-subunit dehydrogenase